MVRIQRWKACRLTMVIFLLGLGTAAWSEKPAALTVDCCYLRRLPRLDTGTSHLFVRNAIDKPVQIRGILLNGESLGRESPFGIEPQVKVLEGVNLQPVQPKKEEKSPVYWSSVSPNPIPPGKVGHVAVKWILKPREPVRLGVETVDGQRCEGGHLPEPIRFILSAVTFSEALDRVYLYLSNESREALDPYSVFLDSTDVSDSVYPFLSWGGLQPGEKRCLTFAVPTPLGRGDEVMIKVTTRQGTVAEAALRAFNSFPIVNYESQVPCRCLDEDAHMLPPSSEAPGPKDLIQAFACASHDYGSLEETGPILLNRLAELRARYPKSPAFGQFCKRSQEEALYAFGEIPDLVVANVTRRFQPVRKNVLQNLTQRVAGIAHDAAAPRPAIMLVRYEDDHRIKELRSRRMTPDELRMYTYYGLSQGLKGVFLEFPERPGREEQEKIEQLVSEIKAVRQYLAVGDPVPLGKTNRRQVEALTIQAGYDHMVVFLINHNHVSRPANEPPVFECQPQESTTITVRIPQHFGRIASVQEIRSESEQRPVRYALQEGAVTFDSGGLQLTKLFLIKANPPL